ncbi:hypothetical protein COCMIDRAFT_110681, partial [Bipolaris oryzae ATCC 44560]
ISKRLTAVKGLDRFCASTVSGTTRRLAEHLFVILALHPKIKFRNSHSVGALNEINVLYCDITALLDKSFLNDKETHPERRIHRAHLVIKHCSLALKGL